MPARSLPPRDPDAMADLAAVALLMEQRGELEAFCATLPADDAQMVEQVLADQHAIGWRADPAAMAHHFDPTYQLWAYVRYLSHKFTQLVDGTSPRQMWWLPGRYGKSTLTRYGMAWALDRSEGRARIIVVSYADTLADESAIAVRDILRAHPDELRCQLRPDRQRQDRFVTEQGGGLLSAGIDGSITGFGCGAGGGIVLDDPFKNWQQAHSEARREHVWNQYRGTLVNRLDDEQAFILVVHHRVHLDDISGRLKADVEESGVEWDITSLPAIAVADDQLGRAPGEPLEPKRFSLAACQARARSMGSYLASALEQQNPTPPEGKELLREWFVLADASELPRRAEQAITSWDLKLKNREAGDYVVGQCWWRVAGGYWLMDQLRGQYDHATTANAIALLAVRHPEAATHVVESAGSADEVLPMLRKPVERYEVSEEMARRLGMSPEEREAVQQLRRRGMARLVPHPPKGDKQVRARAQIAGPAEAGLVRLPADAPWVAGLLDEVAAFPDGTNDDQVDAMSQALLRLNKGQASAGRSRRQVQPPGPQPAQAVRPPARATVGRPTGRIRLPGSGRA